MSSASMGMGMGGMGGGDFPTAIIEGPPGSPGGKGLLNLIHTQLNMRLPLIYKK